MVSITNLNRLKSKSNVGLALFCLLIAGCSGFGSNPSRSAPVYDSVGAKTGGSSTTTASTSAPAIIASKTTTSSANPTATTATSTAIENKAPQGTMTSSVDPYATSNTINTDVTQAGTAVEQTVNTTQGQVDATVASIENDPRFKSGEDVLNGNASSGENHNVPVPETGITVDETKTTVKTTTTTSSTGQTETAVVADQQTTSSTIIADGTETTNTPATQTTPNDTTVAKVDEPKRPENAAQSLIMDARDAVAAGNYEKAASSLERAHSIEPKNAKILYDIAQIRYAQGKYVQSESFASKAAGLSSDNTLSKKIWTLLANSRKALGNQTGAQLAQQKANSF